MIFVMNIQKSMTWGRRVFLFQAFPLSCIIALNYLQSTVTPQSPLSWLYYLATVLGHYGLLLVLTYIFLFWPVVLLVRGKEKVVRIWGLILVVMGSFFHFIDSIIFSQYRFHFNGFIFNLLFGGAAGDIFEFSVLSQLLLLGSFILLSIFLWIWGTRLWNRTQKETKPYTLRLFLTLFISLGISNALHVYGDAKVYRKITRISALFPLYHPLTGKKFLKERGILEDAIKREDEFNDFYYPITQMNCPGKKSPNILFIVIDSWRFDELTPEITPTVSRYASKALQFQEHLSGSNNTRGGIFNLFYGLPSTYWEVALQTRTSPVFVDELLKRKYEMGIFSSASLASPEFNKTVFSKVKNLRITTEGFRSNDRDLKINEEWKLWINEYFQKKTDKPFFGFLFYDSPHAYKFPRNYPIKFKPNHDLNYLALNNDTDPLPVFNRHRNSVHFVDSLIDVVMKDLEEKQLLNDTTVIITSDHGQEFNDYKKNYWGHNSNFGPAQLHVPLIMILPKESPQIVKTFTSHYDIVPTLMNKSWNCSNIASDFSYGQSLFENKNRDWHLVGTYLNYAVIDVLNKNITVINPAGDYENLDFNLNELTNQQMRKKVVFEGIHELNRFMRSKK